MARPKLPIRGRNVVVEMYIGDQKQADFHTKKCRLTQAATLHRDKYLGQQRAIGDKTVEGYDISIDKNAFNGALLRAILANDALREANQPFKPITLIIHQNERDGTRSTWTVANVYGKFDLDIAGQDDPVGEMLELQGEELKAA